MTGKGNLVGENNPKSRQKNQRCTLSHKNTRLRAVTYAQGLVQNPAGLTCYSVSLSEPCSGDPVGHVLLMSTIPSDSSNLFSFSFTGFLRSKGMYLMISYNLDSLCTMSVCGSMHLLPSVAGGSL